MPSARTSSPDSPSDSDPARSHVLLKWLWAGYLRKYIPLLGIALIFMILEGSTLGAISYMMQPMFDLVFVERRTEALFIVAITILVIFTIRAVSGVIQKVILTRIALLTAADLRLDLLNHLIRHDGAFHQFHPPGFLIQRIQADVDAVNTVWRSIITGAGRDAISLIVLMGVAISIDWKWAALACVGTPLMLAPAFGAQRYVRKEARAARDVGARIATRLDEIFHGIVPIKLNRLENYQSQRFKNQTKVFVSAETRAAVGTAAIPGLVDLMGGIGFMCVLLYGGAEIIAGEKTVGQFMSFFTAMGLAFDPMRRLGGLAGIWQSAAAAIERIKELLDTPIRLVSPDNPLPPPKDVPEVILDNINFSYGDTPILTDISFKAEAGKTTALVGASGSGKSTIFNLLTRLVDPDSGDVRIGGIPAHHMSLDDLRDLFSVVTQEALLFDDTLRENVVLGHKDVSDHQLKNVLDSANVTDFLPQLPDSLNSAVGPRGSALSGGQRQRVMIARALLRDAPILLLDEATSALDSQSEKIVQEALDKLSGGRTTLVVAHRLSTVRNADTIIVIDRGRIIDHGTHEELLDRGGIYADLYRLQFRDGKTIVDPVGERIKVNHLTSDDSEPRGLLRRIGNFLRG
ncbi:MAG: ABC transporter ATP-binding protein [Aestuariivita sp.]|nr:ABC transporter ATP-binding protein [Aestuariivita sp.]